MGYPFGKPMFDFFAASGNPEKLMDSLNRFIEFWFGRHEVEYGVSDAKLRTFEMPEPLRRLYAFAGQWPAANYAGHLFTWQDRLVPFEKLVIADDRLIFLHENQGVWRVGTALAGSDPAVWMDIESKWTPVCDSLAQFLVTFVLAESVYGSQVLRSGKSIIELAAKSGCRVVPVWLNGPYAGFTRSVHLVNGEVLVLDDNFVAAQDEAAIESFPVELRTLTVPLKTKEPYWEDASIKSGWYGSVGLVEDLAKRHARQAEAHEASASQHRGWEKYFRELAEKRRLQLPSTEYTVRGTNDGTTSTHQRGDSQ